MAALSWSPIHAVELVFPFYFFLQHLLLLLLSSAPVCVCGPICESGDVFGRDRPLPLDTEEGDILLVDTVGAYGRCMASTYNLRDPGKETVILDSGEIVWPPQ